MTGLANALLPVILVIGLGYGLRRSGLMEAAGWAAVERLVYFLLFPALLFRELATAPFAGQPLGAMAATLLGTQVAMAAVAVGLRLIWRLPGPSYTSVLQGVVRWNSYVALSLIPPLFGAGALPLGAIAIALLVPVANLMSVAALARHGQGKGGLRTLPRAVATNPLILACLAGVAWNMAGLPLPLVASEPLRMLAQATIALGLLTVGAGLKLGAAVLRPGLLLATCMAKLLLMPLLAYALALALGLNGPALGVTLLALGAPTATSAYILARLLGGDAELMAAIVTATTLGAVLTLPLVLSLPLG
jgi:predicted permease